MAPANPRIALLAKPGTSPWFTYSRIVDIYRGFGIAARMTESIGGLQDIDVVLTHNINGLNDADLSRLLDQGVKVVTFVDTPYNKVPALTNTDARVIFVFTDSAYIPLATEINGGRNRIINHPLEISIQDAVPVKPIHERSIDVLFAGRLVDFDTLDSTYSNAEKKRAVSIVEQAIYDEEQHIHELAKGFFSFRKKIGLYPHSFTGEHFLNYCWKLSHSLRKQRKLIVMNELKNVKSGLKYCFISNSPDQIKKLMGEKHSYHDFMPWSDVVALMHDSKMVINTMPGHVDCLHEHMVEAMMSGAVCLSDQNRKTHQVFTAAKHFIPFTYEEGNLSHTLSHIPDAGLQAIATAGRTRISEIVNPRLWVELLDKLD